MFDRSRTSTKRSSSSSSGITDWVVQGLEPDEDAVDDSAPAAGPHNNTSTSGPNHSTTGRITSRSAIQAGENDTLPVEGLAIGKVRILASDSVYDNNDPLSLLPIRLLVGRNGWGTGVHPTTRLCLEWICDIIQGGETVLDYGCGSGILSIAALHLGAAKCIGVDVEAEALVTAVRNVELNGFGGGGRFEALHTREVLPFGITTTGVDVCVANILVGQLVRPSMVAAIITNLAPGGWLCLSGVRPGDQVASLQRAYGDHVEWLDEHSAELAASETEGSLDSYGFDCGSWSRLVGRKKNTGLLDRDSDIAAMSESAVS